MKKKILFVLESLDMGGIARVTCVLGDNLQKLADKEVSIYSTLSSSSYYQTQATLYFSDNQRQLGTLVKKGIAKTKYLLLKKETDPISIYKKEVLELINYIEKKQMNVVILTARLISYAKIIKKKFPEITLIGWVHNNAKTYLEHYYIAIRNHFIENLNELDFLVVLTEEDKLAFSLYIDHVICIYNPLTLENHQGKSNLNGQTISFVGRIDFAHKGIDYLVQVARKLPPFWTIKIAGTGSKKELKKFYYLQKKYRLTDKLLLEGLKNNEELQDFYVDSSFYLMTSRWEGMPLVLAEAMSFGLPILAFEQTGSNEVLKNGQYGLLVENGNIEKLAERMNELIENFELREYYQQQSLLRVKRFAIDHIIQQWLEICK